MRNLIIKIVVAITLCSSALVAQDNIDDVKIMTENWPPFNMMKDKKISGLAVEVLDAVLKQMNSKLTKKDIKLLPWSRAYRSLQNKKNHMLFSITRTEKRENMFKWVGPIADTSIDVVGLKSNKIKIDKASDLNAYKTGAPKNSAPAQSLLSNGVDEKNIIYKTNKDNILTSLKMIKKQRMHFFTENIKVMKYVAITNGINFDDFELALNLKKAQLYFAFNKQTDDKIIKKYQDALDAIKKNGIYNKILSKY